MIVDSGSSQASRQLLSSQPKAAVWSLAAERGPADSNGVAQSRQRGRRGRGGEGPAEEGGEAGPVHLGRDGVAHLRDRAME